MNAATLPPQLPSTSVRPADRLGFTLLIATILHLAVILGVSFTLAKPGTLSKSLEITLSTFKSEEKPKDADYLAQNNQQGSGTLEHKAAPKTTEQAVFQDTQVKRVTPPSAPPQAQRQEAAPKAAIATRSPQQQKTPVKREKEKPVREAPAAPVFDSEQLSAEIASLQAELAQDIQEYAKRPKIHRLNTASTMRDKGAWYKDEWRKKIERVGNLNYPEEARRKKIYGSLILMVAVNRDGTINDLQIVESSGQPALDEAAKRIVRLAAPFAPFTGDMAEFDIVQITRTWRFERSDRLSSN
ncbi:energy transducer TonB [Pseudomonas sp. J452]|uniref:energy transducer TonB n=1 Tax=Pseudomonas sp. J452 TaxID=2898441 RepID=UPI0021ADD027|nr:energy transducer TonB [Pseudomonas sp. J452]UUY09245.1 energy transducer TonB [Pseudomonas sp. J452]